MRTTPTLSRLIAKLRVPDSYTRQLAVESLDGMGAKAVPVLVEFLRDENFYVRGHAARVLGNIGFQAKAAIPLLIEALKDPDSFVRGHAARALGNIGFQAKAAIPLLIEALKDPDSFVSINAAEALGNIGPQAKAAIPALAKALKSWNDEVCKSAANALKNIGSASIPILQTLEEGNPYIRRYMVKMLGEMGIEAKEAMLALIEALYDPDLRDKAVEALKKIGPSKEAVPALVRALENRDSSVRQSAAEILGGMGIEAKEAMPALIKALYDSDLSIRMNAAEVLGSIGEEAVPVLFQALEDCDSHVRESAQKALRKIKPRTLPALLEFSEGFMLLSPKDEGRIYL